MHNDPFSVFNFGLLHMEWPTALFVLVVFVMVMITLNSLLFKPILKTLEARETTVNHLHKQREELLGRTNQLRDQYEAAIKKAHESTLQIHAEKRKGAIEEYQKIIFEAKEEANTQILNIDRVLAEEKNKAIEDSKLMVGELSQLIVDKIVEK